MKRSSRFWAAVIATLLALSLAGCLLVWLLSRGGTVANIYLDGELVRSIDLARLDEGFSFSVEGPAGAKPFVRLAPLATVLAARLGKGEQTKTVQGVYEALLAQLGPEFTVLRQTPAEAIAGLAGEAAAQGVELLRQGQVAWRPGFDGEYGKLSFPGA